MKILDITPQGFIKVGLLKNTSTPKSRTIPLYINNPHLYEWLPVYKTYDYYFDMTTTNITLRHTDKYDDTATPTYEISKKEYNMGDFILGNIPGIKILNTEIINYARSTFGLPHPEECATIKELEEAITKTMRVNRVWAEQWQYVTTYEQNIIKRRRDMEETETNLWTLGSMYSLYSAYKKAMVLRKG